MEAFLSIIPVLFKHYSSIIPAVFNIIPVLFLYHFSSICPVLNYYFSA